MKKILLIVLLSAIVVGCKQKEQPRTTVLGFGTPYIFANEFMNGKVKEVKETLYWAKENNNQVEKGEIVKWKELDSMKFSHSFVAYFDESGQIIKCEYFDENGKIIDYWNGFLENGKVIKAKSFSKDSNVVNVSYKYDENGGLVEAQIFHPIKDTLYNKWVFTNDDKLLYNKIEYYNYKNELRGKNVLQRNENGLVIKREYYNKNDSITFLENLTYNNHNILDSQENFTKGNRNKKWNFRYNNYDQNGNWSNVICSIEGKPIIFAEREYIYY